MNVLDKVILGINDTHDASAAIMRGGKVLCAVAEDSQKLRSLDDTISHQGDTLAHYGLNPDMVTTNLVVVAAVDVHVDLSRISQ